VILKPEYIGVMFVLVLTGCGGSGAGVESTRTAPATVEPHNVVETDLVRITLTDQAKQRLGIATAKIATRPALSFYTVAGEVVVPPGQFFAVSAPTSGTVHFEGSVPDVGSRVEKGQTVLAIRPLLSVPRDLRVTAEADLKAAQARLDAAKERTVRARQMLADRVGSQRALLDAEEAERLAQTALDAAQAKLEQIETAPVESDVQARVTAPETGILRQLSAGSGQMVSGGAPLFEIARLDPIWVRAPVYSGDLALLDRSAAATVKSVNAPPAERGTASRPVSAPPSADPLASTNDLFYVLPNSDHRLSPGERVSVSIPRKTSQECLQAPWAAILYDVNGGAWVYEQMEPLVFARRRVSVERVIDDVVCLGDGPAVGTTVVTDGAAELFGVEFGGAH
jgi:RND family efflux transporter MFP subunit